MPSSASSVSASEASLGDREFIGGMGLASGGSGGEFTLR